MKNEIWQVFVGDQIYKASFAELTHWIAECSLLRTDYVKKGKLRWIQAEKVPALLPFFEGAPPLEIADADKSTKQANPDVCFLHESKDSVYVCKKCVRWFCEECPKHYVRVQKCPVCVDCNHKKEFIHEFIKLRFCPFCEELIENKKSFNQPGDGANLSKLKQLFGIR